MLPDTGHLRLAELPDLKHVLWEYTEKDRPDITPGELWFQTDGNFVAYKQQNDQSAGYSFWSSATNLGIADHGWIILTNEGHLEVRVAQEGGFRVVKRLA